MATALTRTTGRLPHQLTSFVGRRRELAEIRRVLSAERLVTLTGAGGVGKTRLALHAAGELTRSFRDGVWLVELCQVPQPALLDRAILRSLGALDTSEATDSEQLVSYLADREVLVVLDNCEHLVASVAGLADRLLRFCPGVRLLATSREALTINGEHRIRVRPLELPTASAASTDAIALFAERAAAANPGFEVSCENRKDVERIVTRLEGLPLAIELAAVRLRAMSTGELADRLSDRFQVLTQGSRVAPTRHRTLRLCMEWSYQQCTPSEQLLWDRLAVFYGGFELDAVEGVAGFGELQPATVLETLSSLMDKSIVTRVEAEGDRTRFRLLETMRVFAWERLVERGGLDEMLERHRAWYAEMLREAHAATIGPEQGTWWSRLDRERSNIRSMLEATSAAELGELVCGLSSYWTSRGALAEARRWCVRSLAALDGEPSQQTVRLCADGAAYSLLLGDRGGAGDLVDQALRAARELRDVDCTPALDYASGLLALADGDPRSAVTALQASWEAYREHGDLLHGGPSLTSAVAALASDGRLAEAMALVEDGLGHFRQAGESFHHGQLLLERAQVAVAQGDVEGARPLLTEALQLHAGIGDRLGFIWGLHTLAGCESAMGSHERATVCGGAWERIKRDMDQPPETSPLLPDDRVWEAAARASLGHAAYDAALRRGRAMDADALLAFVQDREPPAPRAEPVRSLLTTRETQVAELVTEGHTNAQIATRLFITQRTVRGHLDSIMTKLGFSSRAQVAAWVSRGDAGR